MREVAERLGGIDAQQILDERSTAREYMTVLDCDMVQTTSPVVYVCVEKGKQF